MTVTIHTQGTNATSTGTAVSGALPGVLTGGYPTLIRVASSGAGYFKLGSGTAAAGDLMIQPADHVILTVPEGIYGFSWISLTGTTTVNVEAIEWGHRPIPSSTLDLNFLTTLTTPSAISAAGITFSRAYTAGTNHSGTYFGSDGLLKEAKVNLLQYSEQYQSGITVWARNFVGTGSAPVVTQAYGIAPNGTLTAQRVELNKGAGTTTGDDCGLSGAGANNAPIDSVTRTLSVWLKSNTASTYQVQIRLHSVMQTVSVTPTWTRFSVTASSGADVTLNIARLRGTYGTSDSADLLVWGAQLETGSTASQYIPTTSAASAAPRIDYDPVTLECRGLLIEESRANLHNGDSNAWSLGSSVATIAQNQISPTGVANTGWLLTESITSGLQLIVTSVNCTPTAAAHTVSAFVKAGTATRCQLFIGSGASTAYQNYSLVGDGSTAGMGSSGVSASGIQKLSGGWFRIWWSATVAAVSCNVYVSHINSDAATRAPTYSGSNGLTLSVYGAQIEAGAFPTSYIPTTTTSLTRAADSCSMTGTNFSGWWNATEGTFVVSMFKSVGLSSTTEQPFSISDGTLNNRLQLQAVLSLNNVYRSGGTNNDTGASNTFTAGATFKGSSGYSGAGSFVVVNGGTIVTGGGSQPVSPNVLWIGANAVGAVTGAHCISRLTYFNKRLPDTALQQLTGN